MTGSFAKPTRELTFNLTAVTALVAVIDLLWGRTAARLMLPYGGFSDSVNTGLMAAGGYFAHLTGILSLAVLVSALANASVRQRIFPRPLQASLVFIAALFVLLASRALLGPVGDRFSLYTKVSYAFMAAFVILGALRSTFGRKAAGRRHSRATVGVILFALPGILYAVASFMNRSAGSEASDVSAAINRWGQWMTLVAGLGAGVALSPPSRSLMRPGAFALASAAGIIGAASTFALVVLRFDLLSTVASSGLNLEVPRFTEGGGRLFAFIFAAAAGSTLFALVSSLGARQEWRLVGYGLLLVTAGGYQLSSPALLAASPVGLMAMALGVFALSHAVHPTHEKRRQSAQGSDQDVDPSENRPAPTAQA